MFKATLRRAAAHAERKPMIKFLGKRTTPESVDHTPRAHPQSPTHKLPADFGKSSSASFSVYRQHAQQHGPLGRNIKPDDILGSIPGRELGPVTPAKGEYMDRSQLPPRFRRSILSEAEIEAIETGGATLVC